MTLYSLQPPVDRRTLHDAGVAPRRAPRPVLWMLGYPEQALTSSQEALARAQALAHPESIALASIVRRTCASIAVRRSPPDSMPRR